MFNNHAITFLASLANHLRLLCLTLVLIFSSCVKNKTAPKKEEYVIGFSQCVGSDQWRKTMLDEMKRELVFHSGVTLLYEDANNSSNIQVEQVKSLLERKIDLLIISPNEAKPLTPIVEEAFNNGIPVVVIDRKTSSKLYTAYVGANNYEIGKMAGEYLANRLKQRGKVIEVMGLPGSSPAIERQRGFYDGVKAFPGIDIVKQVYGNWLINKAEQEVLNLKDAKIDAVFAHNDQMALGSYNALKKRKAEAGVKIIGVDALSDNGQQLVANSILTASMLYPTGGKEAVRTALAILNKEPFEKENILKTVVIDSTNVQLMKMQSEKIDSQQKDIKKQQDMLDEQNRIYKDQQSVLNILVVSLVLALVFGGVALIALTENWKNNKKLEAKNFEITQQQQQLLEMSERAKVASEAKFNFFTNISHEFRTPLTLILSPLEDVIADPKLPLQAKDNLKLINRNVLRLLRMVNQLIDFRKIEYDGMRLSASENNLIAFTREILSSFRDLAAKRRIDLKLVSPAKEISVWYDSNMLDKVLFNLLSNSFKFTRDGGKITISIRRAEDGKNIEINVQDTGIGMSEEEREHAFDLFYQGKVDQFKGSGLGLALTKEIIQLHKGDIKVKSEQGIGTAFTILLPEGSSHLAESEKVTGLSEADQNYNSIKIYTTDLENSEVEAKEKAFDSPKDLSLLIIEDNEDLRGFLQQKFSDEYEVFTSADGLQGIREAFDRVPDLIISDVVLPSKTGTEIAQLLKNDIRTSHIPIILLTAKGSAEQQIEGMNAMADAYITKPFNLQYLKASVKNLLRNRNLLKSRFTTELPSDHKQNISSKLDKKFMNEFSGIVESNLANENFSVDDICKGMGISRIQLYRKVKALMDTSITDYILSRRLQKAKYLLLNENLTISEITYQVGFSSPTYFSTVFKAQYKCTPSEFKRNNGSVSNKK
ncbi:substrate-binding domain-containing protein [Desertivirga brevis]|uniref:substrate-binding domain-containing protein n=1 Tax=Desertivirga brevis TaxID=2810310 RepID=UPI001A97BFCE|nr:substrate-binding domain-containing protein [Pedobacter sp. SYSU D00873]